jgi:hypothetical protein
MASSSIDSAAFDERDNVVDEVDEVDIKSPS